jgi:hypothetical protein
MTLQPQLAKVDIAVSRLKQRTIGSYRAPKVEYRCRLCRAFRTESLVEAWTHSMTHGPWDPTASAASAYVLTVSAQARMNGTGHPRGRSQ